MYGELERIYTTIPRIQHGVLYAPAYSMPAVRNVSMDTGGLVLSVESTSIG